MLSTEMRRTREQRLTFFYFCVGLAKPISDFQLLYKMMLSDLCFLHIFSYSFVTYRRERIGYPQTHYWVREMIYITIEGILFHII